MQHSFPLRQIVLVLVWLFVLVSAAGLAGYVYLYHSYLPRAVATELFLPERLDFRVEQGEGVASVATRLREAGVIADDWVFVEYLKREKLDSRIQAGFFQFPAGHLSVIQVAEQLQRGSVEQIRFTVLEGWTAFEIDAALAALGLIEENDFALFVREGGGMMGNEPGHLFADRPVASLEGYLFPTTYFLDPKRFSTEELLTRMLNEMETQLTKAGYDPVTSTRSLHEILTVASMVEREERVAAMQPLVADIIWRRLDDGWQLGIDATLLYTLGHKEFLTRDDLAIDSPYNTRLRTGLPPTPIAAPSASALAATISPEKNNDWYYLHDPTGQIHFAETLAEHNKNKMQYLQ